MNGKYVKREKKTEDMVPIHKRKKDMGSGRQLSLESSILEAQKKIGNKATAELLEAQYRELELYKTNSVYYFDPIQSLTREITNKYVDRGSDLLQYIPTSGERTAGYIPKQSMGISLDTGSLTAGVIKGNGKAVLTAFLRNAAGQTATSADSRQVRAAGAAAISDSSTRVLTNGVTDSAVALILDIASSAKKIIQKIQFLIENEEQGPTGIETLDKLLPFISVKKDGEKLEFLRNELERAKKERHNYSPEEFETVSSILKREIEEVRRIIAQKLRKKKYFSQIFSKAWKDIKKSEAKVYELKDSLPELPDEEPTQEDKPQEQGMTDQVPEGEDIVREQL